MNSAGGKVKAPARLGRPRRNYASELSSARAHAPSLLLRFGPFFSLLCLSCQGKGAEGSKHPPPAPLPASVLLEKHPKP